MLRVGVNHVTGSEAYGDKLVQRFPVEDKLSSLVKESHQMQRKLQTSMQQLSPRMPLSYAHFWAWPSTAPEVIKDCNNYRTPKRTHKTDHCLEMGQQRG